MSRLPAVTSEQLDDDQRRVWEAVTNGRRGGAADLVGPDGALVGPFNAMVFSPLMGERVVRLGEALRFDISLDREVIELATIVVAAHWRSNFEWWAHSRLALAAGVPQDVVDAVQRREQPTFTDDRSATVHRFASDLVTKGRVDAETYCAAVGHFGHRGVTELVSLVGYYCLISLTLNTFQVGTPGSFDPAWPEDALD